MRNFTILLLALTLLSCRSNAQSQGQNAPEHLDKPYVILISLDGFRHDYLERFQPPNLMQFVAEGSRAQSMISCFPSKTFPNHYSIATGMYPANHGIVDNSFRDPARGEKYGIGDRDKVEDGSWYDGTPLWVQAEKNGMVAASFFFVGSEADIQGVRPTYWNRYDGSVANNTRARKAIEWLKLPPESRPHFITLYFSDMDNTGHRVGPNNDEELRKSLMDLDKTLGLLFEGVRETGLPVNIIIVSDHGMGEVLTDVHMVNLDQVLDGIDGRWVNNGPLAHIHLDQKGDVRKVLRDLRDKEAAFHFKAYAADNCELVKGKKHLDRFGDIILVTDYPYSFADSRRMVQMANNVRETIGVHGYDPAIPDMHAIFFANGPQIKPGITLPPFENIHVYPLVCQLLDLPIPSDIDGKAEVLEELVR